MLALHSHRAAMTAALIFAGFALSGCDDWSTRAPLRTGAGQQNPAIPDSAIRVPVQIRTATLTSAILDAYRDKPLSDGRSPEISAKVLIEEGTIVEKLVDILVQPAKAGECIVRQVPKQIVRRVKVGVEAYGCALTPWRWGKCWRDVFKDVVETITEPVRECAPDVAAIWTKQLQPVLEIHERLFPTSIWINHDLHLTGLKMVASGNRISMVGDLRLDVAVDLKAGALGARMTVIRALKTRDGAGPSYIPRNIFVEAVKAFYLKTGPAPVATAAFVQSAMALPNNGTIGQRVIRQAAEQVGASMESIDKTIGDWFDAVMDRLSGVYKRWTQVVIFILGFGVAWAGNLDAIVVANHLANSPAARTQFAEKMAEAMGKASQPDKELQAKIEQAACETRLPIGRGELPSICKSGNTIPKPGSGVSDLDFGNALLKALGFLITALTTTIGAAFWFDLLKRFVNIRAAGPISSSRKEITS